MDSTLVTKGGTLMKSCSVTARAHTNIALVKYWGKKNQELIIPMNNSLSLTLDHFYTDTTVTFDKELEHDTFYLNNKLKDDPKIKSFMNLVRSLANIKTFATIDSVNHVPTQAGLASSASAYAALAKAASCAAGLNLNKTDLSRLARRGSGSACRSIYGGFVEWQQGTNDTNSYAVPFLENVDWDISVLAIVLNSKEKKITSRLGMQSVVASSPYYQAWVETCQQNISDLKKAILARNFDEMGRISEENAMKMHALNLSASPHFNYFEPESLIAMRLVEELRQTGISCYYTLDAGPNVKVLCLRKDVTAIKKKLSTVFSPEQLLLSSPGPGVTLI